jgi:molybdenum cofactor synthesis domain-containing protein
MHEPCVTSARDTARDPTGSFNRLRLGCTPEENMGRTAAAVIIGNEILSGKVEDANGPYLVRKLRELGIELRRIVVVPDEVDAIVDAVAALRSQVNLLVTSGGVGPTHDDVTVRAVAKALARPVVRDPAMEARVREHYGARLTPEALRLADCPQGGAFEPCPGLWLPVLTVENLALLPGVPDLFRAQLDTVAGRFRDCPFHLRVLFLSEPEVAIAATLDAVAARFPDVAIGSYPRFDRGADHRVKLTVESRARDRVEAALEALLADLPSGGVLRVE